LTINPCCARFFQNGDFEKTFKMKQTSPKTTADILHKIENIEKEVSDLKLSVLKNLSPSGKKVISLKGILKGVDFSEHDIASAKKSLYNNTEL
jgi:hypothetical protein